MAYKIPLFAISTAIPAVSAALVTDSSGNIASSAVTATELSYVSGVTSAIQTQLNGKSPLAGSSSIVTVGTITTGVWSGTTIAVNKGGTGVTTSTGSGSVVLSTSPTLTTPFLGVATATSINGLTISTSTGTLTVTNAKTLSVSNTLTLAGTDSSTLNIGTGGTLGTAAFTASSAYQPVDATLTSISGKTLTGSGNLVCATSPTLTTPTLGAATATTVNNVTLTTPATGSTLTIADGKTLTASNTLTLAGTDSTVMTFPSTSATIARTDDANSFAGVQTFTNNTPSTSTTTGGIVGAGGLGIAGAAWIGGAVVAHYSAGTSGDVRLYWAAPTNGVTISSPSSGTWVRNFGFIDSTNSTILGALGAYGTGDTLTNLWIGTAYNSTWMTMTSSQVAVQPTAEATTGGAGAFTCAGGIYAAKAIISNSSTASSSTTTGGIIGAGGLGIAGAAYIGGVVNAKSTTEATTGGNGSIVSSGGIYATKAIISGSTTASTSTTTGGIVGAGGLGISGDTWLGGQLVVNNSSYGSLRLYCGSPNLGITYVTPSSGGWARNYGFIESTNTTLLGGYGAQGTGNTLSNLWLGAAYNSTWMTLTSSQVALQPTTDSSSSTTGSFTVAGGAGIAKKLFVGTSLTVTTGFGCNGKSAQTAYASGGAVASTASTNSTPYGFTTAAQANGIVTLLNNIQAALVANGIMS